MKQLIIILICAICAFCASAQSQVNTVNSTNNNDIATYSISITESADVTVCGSLAQETGENVSLWDALAMVNGVDPTSWTVEEFRAEARKIAAYYGLTYDKSAKGNLAILHHINCINAKTGERVANTTSSTDTKRYIDTTTTGSFALKGAVYTDSTVRNEGLKVLVSMSDTGHVITRGDLFAWAPELDSSRAVKLDTVYTSRLQDSIVIYDTTISVYEDSTAKHISNLLVLDTAVQDIVDADYADANICDCNTRTLKELWELYLRELPKQIRRTRDIAHRELLIGCRNKIGFIVRSHHRYGGRLVEDDVNIRDLKSSNANSVSN